MKHETKNTVEMLAYCSTCGRTTRHSVSGKLRGACLEHRPSGLSKEQERRQAQREQENKAPRLF